jgi:hypothetical protein
MPKTIVHFQKSLPNPPGRRVLNILVNGVQWLNNCHKPALAESKKLQPPNHDFPHCSTMQKTIDRTKKSPTQTA